MKIIPVLPARPVSSEFLNSGVYGRTCRGSVDPGLNPRWVVVGGWWATAHLDAQAVSEEHTLELGAGLVLEVEQDVALEDEPALLPVVDAPLALLEPARHDDDPIRQRVVHLLLVHLQVLVQLPDVHLAVHRLLLRCTEDGHARRPARAGRPPAAARRGLVELHAIELVLVLRQLELRVQLQAVLLVRVALRRQRPNLRARPLELGGERGGLLPRLVALVAQGLVLALGARR
jgi:hypothetical protein